MKPLFNTLFVVAVVVFVAASLCGSEFGREPKDTKIDGSLLGYRSLHHPYKTWKARPSTKRWTGKLSKSIGWDQIKRIHVIYQHLHIRDNEQIESLVRASLDDSLLIETLPADARVDTYGCADLLRLQALLVLTNGDTALLSIGGTGNPVRYPQWTVVEHWRNGIGLALQKRK